MTGRGGFSLVEMVIVLVLAGLVSTAAISMFSTQNQLNAAMTALGESQENARSAVQLAATELRSASGGSVVTARSDRLVLRMPIMMGIICGEVNASTKAVYFPMDGRVIDLRRDVDGYAFRSAFGDWSTNYRVHAADAFRGSSRQVCVTAGNGAPGTDADYATLRVGGTIGNAVMLYREITYYFAASALDASRRAFYRGRAGEFIELAQGFSSSTRFEYQLANGSWTATPRSADLRDIQAIRLLAEVVAEGSSGSATEDATFSLVREIQLRNTQ